MKHAKTHHSPLHVLVLVLMIACMAGGCLVKARGQHEVGVEKVSRP